MSVITQINLGDVSEGGQFSSDSSCEKKIIYIAKKQYLPVSKISMCSLFSYTQKIANWKDLEWLDKMLDVPY